MDESAKKASTTSTSSLPESLHQYVIHKSDNPIPSMQSNAHDEMSISPSTSASRQHRSPSATQLPSLTPATFPMLHTPSPVSMARYAIPSPAPAAGVPPRPSSSSIPHGHPPWPWNPMSSDPALQTHAVTYPGEQVYTYPPPAPYYGHEWREGEAGPSTLGWSRGQSPERLRVPERDFGMQRSTLEVWRQDIGFSAPPYDDSVRLPPFETGFQEVLGESERARSTPSDSRSSPRLSYSLPPVAFQHGMGRGAVEEPRGGKKRRPTSADGSRASKVPRKIEVACDFCRGRKLRCDGTKPCCLNCSTRSQECKYEMTVRRRGPGKAPKGSRSKKAGGSGKKKQTGMGGDPGSAPNADDSEEMDEG
ncbi:hypothetical protein BJ138DRAFT_681021 [Hygrophoropsis aurantiaca]|uniref:Uncharacterized protein n=1 Tax=Hygrophoropsis aurantiaca TaxID=72124 RepID=A0ACB7ZYK1_9AGAM|nr:hypothetical protein BJ138DRAFT_681021 [Hygrophoropsis aurantiaca]